MTPRTRAIAAGVVLMSTLVAAWAADVVVAMTVFSRTAETERIAAAKAAGVDADPRTALEVVADLRKQGTEAYPTAYVGNYWLSRPVFRDTIYPLGGISRVLSVMCSEGPYITYTADERGLTNPPGQWSLPRADVAAVGDSYAQGWCVKPEESFVAKIRARYPATIASGFGASGPLTQLGQMREFLAPLEPKVVLWFYFEGNDLTDLGVENSHPLLPKYLDSGFSQRLVSRQKEVDAKLGALVEERETRTRPAQGLARKASAVLFLTHLTRLASRGDDAPHCCDLALYDKVVREAKTLVEGWGGRLVVVYLPSEPRLAGRALNAGEAAGDSVVSVLAAAGVPVLDLRDQLPKRGSAKELTVYSNSHYSARGHREVASIVLDYLATFPAGDSLRRDSTTLPHAPPHLRP